MAASRCRKGRLKATRRPRRASCAACCPDAGGAVSGPRAAGSSPLGSARHVGHAYVSPCSVSCGRYELRERPSTMRCEHDATKRAATHRRAGLLALQVHPRVAEVAGQPVHRRGRAVGARAVHGVAPAAGKGLQGATAQELCGTRRGRGSPGAVPAALEENAARVAQLCGAAASGATAAGAAAARARPAFCCAARDTHPRGRRPPSPSPSATWACPARASQRASRRGARRNEAAALQPSSGQQQPRRRAAAPLRAFS